MVICQTMGSGSAAAALRKGGLLSSILHHHYADPQLLMQLADQCAREGLGSKHGERELLHMLESKAGQAALQLSSLALVQPNIPQRVQLPQLLSHSVQALLRSAEQPLQTAKGVKPPVKWPFSAMASDTISACLHLLWHSQHMGGAVQPVAKSGAAFQWVCEDASNAMAHKVSRYVGGAVFGHHPI